MNTKDGSKLWSKYYIITILLSVGINLVSHLLLSTIVIHAKDITGSDIYAGFMTTFFTLAALFVRVFIGKILDIVGRKKVLIVGMIITTIAAIMYTLTDNIYIIIISRIIHGIGFGITSTAIATIVTDIVPEDRLLEGIGYAGIAATISSALGPTMALSIIGSDFSNFKELFIMTFIISAITTLSAFPVKYKFNKGEHKRIINNEEQKEVRFFTLGVKFFAPVIVIFILSVVQNTVLCFINLYAKSLSFGNISLFFTIYALATLISRLFINKVTNKFGIKNAAISGFIILTVVLFLISSAISRNMLIILAFPYGLVIGTLMPILNVMVIKAVPKEKRGTANAMYYAALDSGFAIGSLAWGVIAESLGGYKFIFIIAAGVTIIGFAVYLISDRKMSKKIGIIDNKS